MVFACMTIIKMLAGGTESGSLKDETIFHPWMKVEYTFILG
jgi:hypothetical protein